MKFTISLVAGIAFLIVIAGGISSCKLPTAAAEVKDPLKCNIAFDPLSTAEEYSKRGSNLLRGGNYNCAMDDCQAALAMDAGNMAAHACRGRSFLERSELAEAQKDFDFVLAADPENKFIHYQLSVLRRKQKDYHAALREFAIGTSGTTLTHLDYGLRAGINYDKGDFDAASRDYAEAMKLRREFQDFYQNKDYSIRQTDAAVKAVSASIKKSTDEMRVNMDEMQRRLDPGSAKSNSNTNKQ